MTKHWIAHSMFDMNVYATTITKVVKIILCKSGISKFVDAICQDIIQQLDMVQIYGN